MGITGCSRETEETKHHKQKIIFNPDNYPQKVHVTQMAYQNPLGSLYVRETTTEVEKQPCDIITAPEKLQELPIASTTTIESEKATKSGRALKQSWSGITFFEERVEIANEAKYKAQLHKKLEERKTWKAFKMHIEKNLLMQQRRGIGPSWFQELSAAQLALLYTLPEALRKDIDEKTVTSSKRFLTKLGVFPAIESNNLETIINNCELDVMYFLFYVHREIANMEDSRRNGSNQLASIKKLKRHYTVSERILLSSIAYIHMPTMLFKLHLILPPPAEGKPKRPFNVLEPLPEPKTFPEPVKEWYKNDEKERNKSLFDDLATETVSTVMSEVKTNDKYSEGETPSIWTLNSHLDIRKMKSQTQDMKDAIQLVKTGQEQKVGETLSKDLASHSSKGFTTADSDKTYPSFTSYFKGLNNENESFLFMQSFTQTAVSFHDNNYLSYDPQSKPKDLEDSEVEKIEQEIAELLLIPIVKRPEETEEKKCYESHSAQTETPWIPYDVGDELSEMFGEEYINEMVRKDKSGSIDRGVSTFGNVKEVDLEEVIANLISSMVRKLTEEEKMRKERIRTCLENNDIDGLYRIFGLENPKEQVKKIEEPVKKSKKKKNKEQKTHTKTETEPPVREPTKQDINLTESENALQTENEVLRLIKKILTEVEKQPTSKQLKYAIDIIAAAGDPVALLPGIIKHPLIQRWYEIRKGINRKLTEKEKSNLMARSRKAWGFTISRVAEIEEPKVNLTPEELAKFTWDRRNWLKKNANKLIQEYNREVKQALCDDAKNLYPSMFTTYYESQLVKNFREVYFTYLPAKEDDYYLFQPMKEQ